MRTLIAAACVLSLFVAPALAADSPAGGKMSGPYTYDNLTVYLVHGAGTVKGDYLTLDEALAAKKVIVHETGDVNSLAIENQSDQAVYVQSGDIVKGGRQDRTLGADMVLAPHSKRIPIASFCVEHGRWTGRGGGQSDALFQSSTAAVAGPKLKLAANANYKGGEQQKVWDEVAKSQEKLAANVATPAASAPPPAATPPAATSVPDAPAQVAAAEASAATISGGSGGSFQLTLENKDVQAAVDKYVDKLKSAAADSDDAIGYIAVVNGKVSCSDVYGSTALFKKLWPKLLKSAATEAATEKKADATFKPLDEAGVNNALLGAEDGKPSENKVNERTTVKTIESTDKVLFITRDKQEDNAVLHRSILPKEQ
jgi:hypothetical protein